MNSIYDISLNNCRMSMGYLAQCDNICERGIRFIENGEYFDKNNLKVWYDKPDRAQYHFEPQAELLTNETRKGGAFSGSALICKDEMEIYMPRHNADPKNEADGIEYQVMLKSYDGFQFDLERTIIKRPQNAFSYNFRYPKAFIYNDTKMLVLGSLNNDVPAILLYRKCDGKWKFQNSLLEEHITI